MSGYNWDSAAPLSTDDQRLIDAYVALGRSVDDLAYSVELENLCDRLYGNHDRETLRETFLRLLRLRKQARLPRPASAAY